ncbi:predicted metallophosphoesterase [gamma proteobacterium HdN1]|nr:predicted metallophosphoesterase [gamma proteobacterium HdN1]
MPQQPPTAQRPSQPRATAVLRILQLSDSHLFASEQGKLLGLNTEYSLCKVLDLVDQEQSAPDLVLATGDLSQDHSVASYLRFHDHMQRFKAPVYWLQGNHDLYDAMKKGEAAERIGPCVIDLASWRIVLLDSSIPRKVPGRFSPSALEFLRTALAEAQDRHLLVALHHQPVKVGSPWLDVQMVGNADEFWAEIDRSKQVRAVIWGHVHQVFETMRNQVKLMSVPSTCVQFKPNSVDFAVDTENPGYRWLDLYPDGRVESGVSRVSGVTFEVDYSVKGY